MAISGFDGRLLFDIDQGLCSFPKFKGQTENKKEITIARGDTNLS